MPYFYTHQSLAKHTQKIVIPIERRWEHSVTGLVMLLPFQIANTIYGAVDLDNITGVVPRKSPINCVS